MPILTMKSQFQFHAGIDFNFITGTGNKWVKVSLADSKSWSWQLPKVANPDFLLELQDNLLLMNRAIFSESTKVIAFTLIENYDKGNLFQGTALAELNTTIPEKDSEKYVVLGFTLRPTNEEEMDVLIAMFARISKATILQKEGKTLEEIKAHFLPTIYQPIGDMTLNYAKAVEVINSKYIYCNDFLNTIELMVKSQKNGIFYGRGGHAKSGMTADYLRGLGLITQQERTAKVKAAKEAKVSKEQVEELQALPTMFIQALGQGTQLEHLLGGMDLKKFRDEGVMWYLPHNSFMNSEYVILEEALDCPMAVLEQLKDILTSKALRNGNQYFPIKTKCIIICTNRTRESVSEDDSLLALMERFPLDCKVEWESYDTKDYAAMFEKVTGNNEVGFADLVAETCKSTFISPRTAIHALEIYKIGGVESLAYIAGFDKYALKRMQQAIKEKEAKAAVAKKWKVVHAKSEALLKYFQELGKDSAIKAGQAGLALAGLSKKLKVFPLTDNLYDSRTTLVGLIDAEKALWDEAYLKLIRPSDELTRQVDSVFRE